MRRHWRRLPPMTALLASYVGFRPPPLEAESSDGQALVSLAKDWRDDVPEHLRQATETFLKIRH